MRLSLKEEPVHVLSVPPRTHGTEEREQNSYGNRFPTFILFTNEEILHCISYRCELHATALEEVVVVCVVEKRKDRIR